MKSSVVRAFGLFATVLVAGAAGAQTTQAVEWKVSEGGNGHWYQWIKQLQGISWTDARNACRAMGGYLATPTSGAENEFVFSLTLPTSDWLNRFGPWLGGYQDKTVSDYSEPSGGWRWVSGEAWGWTAWWPGEPSNFYCTSPGEDRLHFIDFQPKWNDITDAAGECEGSNWSYLVEWSADCNGDGIVDYGQILRGELEDLNSNGVPDICETSISSVLPPSVPAQGGSTITIRGNGFPVNPTVLVGGVPATNVVRESLTRITATSPAVMPGMKSVSVNGFTLPDGIYIRPECGSDLDQDGEVTAADIAIVLLDFGPCYVTATTPQSDDPKPFMLQDQPAPAAPQSR